MPLRHVVQQGECLATIARRFGFASYKKLYDDPANAALKKLRPNPNVLRPGDVVMIPDKAPKEVDAATGTTHRFRVKVPAKELRLVLRDHGGDPIADTPYELSVGDEVRTGTTDGKGKLKEAIPDGIAEAELVLLGRALTLRLGHLDPLDGAKDKKHVAGLQGRLKNLGYDTGPADGRLGRRTRAAIAMFQADHGLEVDGEPGDGTLAKLEESHGC